MIRFFEKGRVRVPQTVLFAAAALALVSCGGGSALEAGGASATTPASTTTTWAATPRGAGLTTTTPTTVATRTATQSPTTAPVIVPVRFETSDDLDLAGFLYPGGTTWVIMGGGFNSGTEAWHGVAMTLQNEGFTALVFENRGRAESEGLAGEHRVDSDAEAAVAYARASGAEGIVFVGADMNGTAAIYIADIDDVDAVVAVSGFLSYKEVDVSLASLDEPRLIITAENDWSIQESMSLHDDLPGPSELFVVDVPGTEDQAANHGMGLVELPEVVEVILNFIRESAS